jgi:hypothetical protein
MPQKDGPRLESRDLKIWRDFLCGTSQPELARKYKLVHQRISQIIAEQRAKRSEDLADVAKEDLARLDLMLSGVMPQAISGDTKAIGAAKGILERKARMLGLDATEPLGVVLARQDDDSGRMVSDVLSKVLGPLVDAATDDSMFHRELELYAAALARHTLIAMGGEDPGPAPVPPQRPAPAPVRKPIAELTAGPGWAGSPEQRAIRDALAIIDADVLDDDDTEVSA